MSNSGIICNLTYPDSLDDYKSQDKDFSIPFLITEERKPIIVLFGWAGSEDKYLSVYSRIYEAKGFITLRCIVPLKILYWRRSRMSSISKNLVQFIVDLQFGDRGYIIHLFSTGGAFAYQHFVQAVKRSNKPIQIEGVIFDSAPSKRRIKTLYTAIRHIIGGNVVFNYAVSFLSLLACFADRILEFILKTVFKTDIREFNSYVKLLNEESKWPQHFIYSKADVVTLYQDVKYFAEHRKSLGVEVSEKMYENTPHVKHYPQNKLSYTKSVLTFVNKCLESSMV